jgi:hypothetical protein
MRLRSQPLATESMTERIGMFRIPETVPYVELTVIIPSLAAPDLNAAFAVERQHGIPSNTLLNLLEGSSHPAEDEETRPL